MLAHSIIIISRHQGNKEVIIRVGLDKTNLFLWKKEFVKDVIKNMSNTQNQIIQEDKKDWLVDELAKIINLTREEPGLSLEQVSQVFSSILEPEELESLIIELLDRGIESSAFGKCVFCEKPLTREDFLANKKYHKDCLDKEIEDKINTDFVEEQKPIERNGTDF